jgi:signal transduction histidine kinase
VERHAQASRVEVSLCAQDDGVLELRIEDDGVGFSPEATRPGHFGIVGMREQAQLIGAELSFRSVIDQGSVVRVLFGTRPDIQA